VAEAVQVAAGAQQAGDDAQLKAGRAICATGGWLYGKHQHEDVRCEEQFVAWRIECANRAKMFLDNPSSSWHGHGVGGDRSQLLRTLLRVFHRGNECEHHVCYDVSNSNVDVQSTGAHPDFLLLPKDRCR